MNSKMHHTARLQVINDDYLADPQMTMSFQIHDRVQELRREVVEILATDQPGHHSGPEKVKHDKRIERLWQIRNELFALIAKRRTTGELAGESQGE